MPGHEDGNLQKERLFLLYYHFPMEGSSESFQAGMVYQSMDPAFSLPTAALQLKGQTFKNLIINLLRETKDNKYTKDCVLKLFCVW